MANPQDLFWDKVDASGDCWLWTAALNHHGYGSWSSRRLNLGTRAAHRIAWMWLVGPIPNGMQIDHLCRVRNCVNPDHLMLATPGENVRRGFNLGRPPSERCLRGHEKSGDNVYVDPRGRRRCKACRALEYQPKPPKTHCRNGHPYDEDNVYVTPAGTRQCRICKRRNLRRWRAKSK